ncbi:MAG: recombinase family protein [Candidatus Saccharibacteria bacterium]|nr:recombinase family protein [Candidatus Saccharibacteria bacterium]
MFKGIEDGKYNCILAWDTSRLSRNSLDGGRLQWLMDSGVLRGIRTHEKWYLESDELIFSIENSMNTRYIKTLKVNVRRGQISKSEKGDFSCVPPVGYKNDRENKVIIKDPIMFDRVAALWLRALTGIYSIAELTRIADRELGIKTQQFKRKGGKPLSPGSIKNLLTNPFYTGRFRWGGKIYNGNHPRMISDAQFEQMQQILNPEKYAARPQENIHEFILSGLITCSECGHAIVTEKHFKKLSDGSRREYHYCHCCNKGKNGKCKYRSVYVREEELIEQVKAELSRYAIDDDFYNLAREALIEEDSKEVLRQDEKISQINKQITETKKNLDNLRRSVYMGLIPDKAFFLAEQESLENEIARLEDERSKVMAIANDWKDIANDAFMFARYAKEDFDSDDWERKRAVIKRLGASLKLSGRTIEFTPVKYLVPVTETKEFLKAKKEVARTAPEQIKKGLKEGQNEVWWILLGSNQ